MVDYGWSVVQGIKVSPIQRQFISAALHTGQSVNAALRALSATGLGIRRSVGLEIAREIRGIEKAGYTYQSIRYDYHIAENKIPETSQVLQQTYKYWGNVTTVSRETGVSETRYFTFGHNENLTRRDLESIATEIVYSALDQYEEELESVHVTGVTRRRVE